MTSVLQERIASGYTADQAPTTPDDTGHTTPEHQNQLTPQQRFAQDAIARFFSWLEDSPNNPNYLSSPTYLRARNWLTANQPALEEDIITRLESVTYDHIDHDSFQLNALHDERDWDKLGDPSIPKMFHASEIATAGIQEVISKARAHQIHEMPEGGIEEVNRDTIQAIGAQIVRFSYLANLSNMRPGALDRKGLEGFENIYRQNITSDIHRAALIKAQIGAAQLADNVVPIKKAA